MPATQRPTPSLAFFRALACSLLGAALGALILNPGSASGHGQNFGVFGKKLNLRTDKGPSKYKFYFKGTDEIAIGLQHDPATEGATLYVGSTDPNMGHTGLIQLNPTYWTTIGAANNPKGYKYKDKSGSQGGITRVILKEGKLILKAKGENWPWAPNAPPSSVRVHLKLEQEWLCAEFGGVIKKDEPGRFLAKGAANPLVCPAQTCGNGELEPGEECDDGNLDDEDGCTRYCVFGVCTASAGDFDTTYEGIQSVIFNSPTYGCSTGVCHGAAVSGDLDLTDANSYGNLVGVLSPNYPIKRVEPGEPDLSFLYDKLVAGTFGGSPVSGSAMPVGSALTEDHLEAIRLWIRGGAPEDLVVEGTADLLDGCLPPPDPLTIPIPDAPDPNAGIQLRQTPWPMPAQSEDEICMATYYDFTAPGLVPAWAKVPCPPKFLTLQNPSGECIRYHKYDVIQDPQSHHSILRSYIGAFDTSDEGWGGWTYKFQDPNHPLNGQVCDPLAVDPNTGYNPGCSSEVQSQIACLGSGPSDLSQGIEDPNSSFGSSSTAPSFAFSQETYFEREYADGVYRIIPMQGIIVWNSHAFNLTASATTMSQYLNIHFADPNDQLYELQEIFEAQAIFVANVPPFETRTYCRTFTAPQGANVFELSSHTHRHGVLWRTWPPPNTPCVPGQPACQPKDPSDAIYISTDYSDPLQLILDPAVVLDSANAADRTYLYCSVYDNGSTPSSPAVKLQSTSPVPPLVFGLPLGPGGPCADSALVCVNEGPMKGDFCNADDTLCDSFQGSGDGDCDGCPVVGGVTTEDEMFILVGGYFLP